MLFLLAKGRLNLVWNLIAQKPWVSFTSGAINAFSYLFLLYAMQWVELSVIEPLTQSSTLLTLVLSAIIFKETIKEKLPGVVLILIGSYLLITQI
jgi:transporter family protein